MWASRLPISGQGEGNRGHRSAGHGRGPHRRDGRDGARRPPDADGWRRAGAFSDADRAWRGRRIRCRTSWPRGPTSSKSSMTTRATRFRSGSYRRLTKRPSLRSSRPLTPAGGLPSHTSATSVSHEARLLLASTASLTSSSDRPCRRTSDSLPPNAASSSSRRYRSSMRTAGDRMAQAS